MRSSFILVNVLSGVILLTSCTKEYHDTTTQDPPGEIIPAAVHKYGSMKDFFKLNQVQTQQFTANAAAGATITSAQGSIITIFPNSFVTQQGDPVTGNVTIEFREIYSKSDMLKSDKPTIQYDGGPLKSGGEFFIKAVSGGSAVQIAPGYYLTVEQPFNGFPFDPGMTAFTALTDTFRWQNAQNATVNDSAFGQSYTGYIYGMFTFNPPLDSGTWSNSDNSAYFNQYPQTILTLQQNEDPSVYGTEVFLLFSDINSMVHVYGSGGNDFAYLYAPEGLNCTMVALGVKDSVLYSSFVPVTISSNQTVNFSMSQTSDEAFQSELELLN